MEETIKMKSKNSDGIEIIKDVPKSLYSNYLAIGWEVAKETKNVSSPKSFINKTTLRSDKENLEEEDKDNGKDL